MKKPVLIGLMVVGLLALVGLSFFLISRRDKSAAPVVEEKVELPVNTIPVEERPFLSLTPDLSGRNLELTILGVTHPEPLEYELLYNTEGSQEGALGAVNISAGTGPFTKSILLGTRSAGGATTYHEGVTGGSLDITYGDIRLKEQFNFLRFVSTEPLFTSSDARFNVTLPAKAFKDGQVIVVMKTFGLPAPMPEGATLVAGPYGFFTPASVKGEVETLFKLAAGTYENAAIYTFVDEEWVVLKTTLVGEDSLKATSTSGSVFIVATQ